MKQQTKDKASLLDNITPLPWNNNLNDGNIFCSGGIEVANCYSSLRSPQTIKANAAYVSEACNNYPELKKQNELLLEALKMFFEIESDPVIHGILPVVLRPFRNAAKEAIQQAEANKI
jgi:hypothetical protein